MRYPAAKGLFAHFTFFLRPVFSHSKTIMRCPFLQHCNAGTTSSEQVKGFPIRQQNLKELWKSTHNMCVVEEETVNNPFDIGLSQRGFMPHNSPQVVPNVQRTKGATKTTRICPLPPQIKPLLIINGCLTFRGYLDVVQCLVFRCQMFNDVHRFFRGD